MPTISSAGPASPGSPPSARKPGLAPLSQPRDGAILSPGALAVALVLAALPLAIDPVRAQAVPGAEAGAGTSAGTGPATTVVVELAAQPLAQALAELARQTGTTLVAAPALLDGRSAPAVSGQLTARQAYQQLLSGSGLEPRFDGSVVTVQQGPAPAPSGASSGARGETTLAAVTVVGASASPATTEGTQSYTTRVTSASTGLELAPREIPQSVSVVTRQQVEDQNLTQLTEVAGAVAGLYVLQGGNVGSDSSTIYARGFAVDNYLVDGVKMLSSYSSLFQSQDSVLFDRIEVVRGASGLMVGAGSPGAAINLIRRRPTRDFQGSATLNLGSWKYRRLDIDLSSPLNAAGTLRGRVLGAVQDAGSYIDRLDEDRKVFAGILEADLTPSTLLRVGATYQRHDATGHSRGGRPAYWTDGTRTDWGRHDSAGASWAWSRRHSTSTYVQLEQQLPADWKLNASLMRIVTDSDELVGYLGGTPDRETGAGARIWATHWVYKPTQDMAQLSASGGFDWLGRRHDIATGLSLARSRQRGDPRYTNWNHEGWDPMVPNIYTWDGSYPTQPPNPTTGYGDSDEHNYSAYASLRLRATDALALILGSRITNWERDERSYTYATGEHEQSLQKENGKVVPYFGITYDLSKHWSAYGSYTTIFQPQTNRTVTGDFLDPLMGNSREIGVKGAFHDSRLNVAAALYEIHEDNKAIAITDVYAPNGAQAYMALSGTRSRGIELEASGEISPGWQVIASYAHNLTRDRDGERLATNVPKKTFKLFSTVLLPSVGNGLTVGGGVNWQSEVYTENLGPARATFLQPSYALVQLMARYPLTDSVTASFHLGNALDKVYYGNTGASYYGRPRSARLALSVKF